MVRKPYHQTESVLLELYEYRMKQAALQSRVKHQGKKKAIINIGTLTNNGTINEISGSTVQIDGSTNPKPQIEQ